MKQITLVVEDKVGLLADISDRLSKSKVNIDAIEVSVVGGKAVVHLSVSDEKRAIAALQASGYECLESDLLAVKLSNAPGELSKMTKLLADGGVNVQNFTLLTQSRGESLYALKVDETDKALRLLSPYLAREN